MVLTHGRRLGTPASAASASLLGRRDFSAGQSHGLKNFFQAEFGLSIRTLARLLAVEDVLVFVSSGTVLLSHRKSTGPSFFLPRNWRQHTGLRSRCRKCTTESQTFANVLDCNKFGALHRRKCQTNPSKTRAFPPCVPAVMSTRRTTNSPEPARSRTQ